MEEFFNQIANLGFPIAVATYLLVRVETKLSKLTDSINELSRVIEGIRWNNREKKSINLC